MNIYYGNWFRSPPVGPHYGNNPKQAYLEERPILFSGIYS